MTITSQTNKFSFTGTGSTTVFAYTNKIFAQTDLVVTIDDAVQTLTSQYTVSGVGDDAGGNVTFINAPANGTTVILQIDQPRTQATDYVVGGPFPALSHENALDKITSILQTTREITSRALTFAIGTIPVPATLVPDPVANKLLGWSSGLNLVNTDLPTFSTDKTAIVNTIAALKAVDSTTSGQVLVTGYFSSGDGGGGHYYFDSADTSTADNSGTVIVGDDGARWKLIFTDTLSIKQFGSVGDNVIDDTAAINKAVTALQNFNTLYCPEGEYLVTGGINFRGKWNITILGEYRATFMMINHINADETIPTFDFDNADDNSGQLYRGITVKRIAFYPAIINATVPDFAMILTECPESWIEGCTFINCCDQFQLFMTSSWSTLVNKCYFTPHQDNLQIKMNALANANADGGCIKTGIEMNNMKITSCRIKNSANNVAVNLGTMDVCEISGNAIESNTAGGISIGGDIRALKIEQNYFEGSMGIGSIVYAGSGQSLSHYIGSNYFNQSGPSIVFTTTNIIQGLSIKYNYFDPDGDCIVFPSDGSAPAIDQLCIEHNFHQNVTNFLVIKQSNLRSTSLSFPANRISWNDNFATGIGFRPYPDETLLKSDAIPTSPGGTIAVSSISRLTIPMVDQRGVGDVFTMPAISPFNQQDIAGKIVTVDVGMIGREDEKTITGITAAEPPVVSVATHGYSIADKVYIEDVSGMTEVNKRWFRVGDVPTAGTFEINEIGVEILSVTKANPMVITTETTHGFAVDDKVYVTGVVSMTEINNLEFTVTAVGTLPLNTLTLGATDSTNFTTYTSGPGDVSLVVDGTGFSAHSGSSGTASKATALNETLVVTSGSSSANFVCNTGSNIVVDSHFYVIVDPLATSLIITRTNINDIVTTTQPSVRLGFHADLAYHNTIPVTMTAADTATTTGANTGTAGAGLSLIGDTTSVNQAANLMNDLVALKEDITNLFTRLGEIEDMLQQLHRLP